VEYTSLPVRANDKAGQNQGQEVMKTCALYALNDMLLREGKITAERKQAVDFKIWKQYRFCGNNICPSSIWSCQSLTTLVFPPKQTSSKTRKRIKLNTLKNPFPKHKVDVD